jgi:hypothetical protein
VGFLVNKRSLVTVAIVIVTVIIAGILLLSPLIPYTKTVQVTGSRVLRYTISEWYIDGLSGNTCYEVRNDDNESGVFSVSIWVWNLPKNTGEPTSVLEIIYSPFETFNSEPQALSQGQTGAFVLENSQLTHPDGIAVAGFDYQTYVSAPQVQYSYNQTVTNHESIIQWLMHA